MSQLSQSERDAFFKRTFGVTGDKPFTERRYTSLASWTLDGRPIHAEYRTAHRSLPGPKRMSPAELDAYFTRMQARIGELEAGATC